MNKWREVLINSQVEMLKELGLSNEEIDQELENIQNGNSNY